MDWFQRYAYKTVIEGPGRLRYCEGNRDCLFPFFKTDDQIVVVGVPSECHIRFFFTRVRTSWDFTASDNQRILPRLLEFFQKQNFRAKLFDLGDSEGKSFVFRPELFAERSNATEVLNRNEIVWFSDYSSIDLLHEEYGLQICGIKTKALAERIGSTMKRAFPHWHRSGFCCKDRGPEQGWCFSICMLPRRRRDDGNLVSE